MYNNWYLRASFCLRLLCAGISLSLLIIEGLEVCNGLLDIFGTELYSMCFADSRI